MGPMVRGRPFDRKRVARWTAITIVALFVWSFIAAPSAQTEETEVVEPENLSAYDALADATPIAPFIDHRSNERIPVALAPLIAHSNAEVSYPSAATSIAWLLDGGLVNAQHGQTTGAKVPTEATASQPGGTEEQEFFLARDTAGNRDTARYGAGVARATAEHSDRPRGFAHSYLANLVLLPAPGSPEEPPGTYDPAGDAANEQEHPETFAVPSGSPTPADDPRAFTPNPRQQMALFSIGSMASTTDTIREEGRVISIAVAEINGINIGNRTGDGRCTNCITIDSIRIEARAESDSTKEGAFAAWRLLIHRACRVSPANDAKGNVYESVTCLDPDPDKIIEVVGSSDPKEYEEAFAAQRDPNGRGVRRVESLEKLNEMFQKGLEIGDFKTGDLQFRMFFGKNGTTTIEDRGEVASAVARGLEFQVTSVPSSAALKYLEDKIGMPAKPVIDPVQKGCEDLPPVGTTASAPCPNGAIATAQDLRTVGITLGRVSVTTAARAGSITGGGDDGGAGDVGPQFPTFTIPEINIPEITIPPQSGGGGQTVVVGGGLPSGKLRLKIDWSSVSVKPWGRGDMTKAIFAGALGLALVALIRRRLWPTAG